MSGFGILGNTKPTVDDIADVLEAGAGTADLERVRVAAVRSLTDNNNVVPVQRLSQNGTALALSISRAAGVDCVQVSGATTGTNLFQRAYRDTTVFTSGGTGAYCSYDANATLTGTTPQNHFYGYEARNNYTGTDILNVLCGYVALPTVAGPVNAFRAFSADTPTGAGAVDQYSSFYAADSNYGTTVCSALYSAVSAGTNKFAVNAAGTAKSYFGGSVTLAATLDFSSVNAQVNTTTAGMAVHTDVNTNLVFGGTGTISQISALNDARNAYGPLFFNASVVTVNVGGAERIRFQNSGRVSIGSAADNGADRLQVTGSISATLYTKVTPGTVAALTAAATAGAGARAFVTDATAAVFASAVVGGGAIAAPVYSDGSTWRVG
jgi:hypothetical protein